MRPSIIVHGGAWDIPQQTHEAHKRGCLAAAEIGYGILTSGGSSLDAVEAAVRAMEEDTTFDAGKGSFLNRDGEVELDAIIMEGKDLRFGSVAAVQHVLHPITLARQVMEQTPHCMLVGDGALRFARQIGMPLVPENELLTERELERWEQIRKEKGYGQRAVFEGQGTVGAVAIDADGVIVAATSTGGTPNKMAGRVGDSPLVGCGAYADDESAGVSVTGLGESLMKIVMARRVCELVERGATPQHAAHESISFLEQRVQGLGGAIVLDRKGRSAFSHNTPHMAVATIDGKGERIVRI
jgi:beta-aspartyl-peptidase (threonine type)